MKCQDCGKDGAEETTCPYAQDVNNTIVEIVACDDCYSQRCMDI